MSDAGKEGFRTGGIQERRDAGEEEAGWRYRGHVGGGLTSVGGGGRIRSWGRWKAAPSSQ